MWDYRQRRRQGRRHGGEEAKDVATTIRAATTESVDPAELAAVAAQTFPLACPPTVDPENIATFVAANLSAARFAEYLDDPDRALFAALRDGRIVGYAMLVRGVGDDSDVHQAVTAHPAVELSKMYVLPDYHGSGVAAALMDHALTTAARWGARCVWLGVEQKNARAQRFYAKCGFANVGARTFQVGTRCENDYVMVREIQH